MVHAKVLARQPNTQVTRLLQEKQFTFRPPSSVDLIGAAAQGTLLASSVQVDVALEMPSACFLEKDYLNGRCGIAVGPHADCT